MTLRSVLVLAYAISGVVFSVAAVLRMGGPDRLDMTLGAAYVILGVAQFTLAAVWAVIGRDE